ncbi:MAG: phage tail protein [Solirubrobacteraceae bacterium]
MADPFLAEIRIFAGEYAPLGWAFCNGQLLPISQNTALFSLLGTNYGGDGKSTFGLPNLMGSAPMAPGQGPGLSLHDLGESGGTPAVSLIEQQLPPHTHTVPAYQGRGQNASTPSAGQAPAASQGGEAYGPAVQAPAAMASSELTSAGGGEPHDNMMPSLGLSFVIALEGIYPSRS